jgi:hypothetical protein
MCRGSWPAAAWRWPPRLCRRMGGSGTWESAHNLSGRVLTEIEHRAPGLTDALRMLEQLDKLRCGQAARQRLQGGLHERAESRRRESVSRKTYHDDQGHQPPLPFGRIRMRRRCHESTHQDRQGDRRRLAHALEQQRGVVGRFCRFQMCRQERQAFHQRLVQVRDSGSWSPPPSERWSRTSDRRPPRGC